MKVENEIAIFSKKTKKLFAFHGVLDKDNMALILTDCEYILEDVEDKLSILRRVYNLIIELVQNVYHHTITKKNTVKPYFYLGKGEYYYEIITGNTVKAPTMQLISGKLDKLNALEREELVLLYRETLNNGLISEKGGSGLGFIEMKRRSRNNLEYKFIHVMDDIYYFMLKITV